MRTVFEEEEEEIAQPDQSEDREVTIGATTLLAIFFGLVLICGLFFGLGYTVGRRAPAEAAQLPANTAPSSSALQAVDSQPKPSAASQPTPTPTADVPQSSAADSPTDAQPGVTAGSAAASEPQVVSNQPKTPVSAPASTTPPQVKPAIVSTPQPSATFSRPSAPAPAVVAAALPVTAATSSATASAPAPGIMVQIAAISNPADANVLLGALQKRGYSVTARHLPGDSLIHVQAGPFSSRAEANAMKQKLLGDGYNAFLK
ncbi:MAG TPA: SPOR domain-containing protein [Acidobacteriaceae bacterium]|jgi:cell division septation protein DedD|nr:SPOR domain-containing protein [Acidobacteriaceae bacterium]